MAKLTANQRKQKLIERLQQQLIIIDSKQKILDVGRARINQRLGELEA